MFFAKILVGAAQGIYSGMLFIVPVVDLAVTGGYLQGFHCMQCFLGYDFLIGHSANTGRRLVALWQHAIIVLRSECKGCEVFWGVAPL